MSDKNSDKYSDSRQPVVLHPTLSNQTELNLIKANRMLFYSVIALMTVVIVFGLFLMPKHLMLTEFEKQQAILKIQNSEINPVLSEEVKQLKSQLVGLISGSIESKLRILEESIQSGTLTSTGVGVIKDLKNDVIVLKTYSETGAGRLIASNTEASKSKVDRQLINEVSQLKNLLYVTIASCGLMVAAIGGVWVQSRYRLGFDRKENKLISFSDK